MGAHWSKIAKHFQNRTENSIKNRFYSSLRKTTTSKRRKLQREKILNEEIESQRLGHQAIQYIPALVDDLGEKDLTRLKENALENLN